MNSATTEEAALDVPSGFRLLAIGGDYMAVNGPLYVRMVDDRAQLGFRVEKRHTNPLNNCHGGMLASFGDMLCVPGTDTDLLLAVLAEV